MSPRSPRRSITALGVASALLAISGLVAASTVQAQTTASASASRIATAELRDLRVTNSVTGTLARSDTTTILYGGVAMSGPTAGGTVERANFQAADVDPVATIDTIPTTPTTTALLPTTTALVPMTTTEASPTTTTSAPSPTTTTTTAPPPTTTTTTAPPPTTTTTTTAPPPTTTTTTAPPPPPTTTTMPQTTTGATPPSRSPAADPAGAGAATPTTTPAVPTGSVTTSSATPAASTPATAGGGSATNSSATITALLDVGAVAGRGSELYRADEEPVIALLADTPLFRSLSVGVDDGPDVQALEQNLVDLGQGGGLTVDETYDETTAAAVKAWEESLGRSTPDGSVVVGEVVFLAGPATVLAHEAAVGDLVRPGSPVLTVGTESQVVEAGIDVADLAGWTVGADVELGWADDTVDNGTVVVVGRDESEGEVAVTIALAAQEATWPIGTQVEVIRTTAERRGVVTVPVAAVVAGPDGPSVRPAGGDEDKRLAVDLGLVADHWVEITSGIPAGTKVRLPG